MSRRFEQPAGMSDIERLNPRAGALTNTVRMARRSNDPSPNNEAPELGGGNGALRDRCSSHISLD